MIIGRSSTKFLFFYADLKFKMAANAGHRLTLDPMGKCSNAFFSETTNMINAKLYMNVHLKLGRKHLDGQSSIKIALFVPIHEQIWLS